MKKMPPSGLRNSAGKPTALNISIQNEVSRFVDKLIKKHKQIHPDYIELIICRIAHLRCIMSAVNLQYPIPMKKKRTGKKKC